MSDVTASGDSLHRDWLLGTSDHGVAVTEVEWGILRFFAAFERSCEQLSRLATPDGLKFQEVIVVGVVAMQRGHPTASSLARQLNRDDVQNLQYTLRKLVENGYLSQSKKTGSRVVTYGVSDKGKKFVVDYFLVRSKLLTKKTGLIEDIDDKLSGASELISVLTGLYDGAAMTSSTYSPFYESRDGLVGVLKD